MKEHGEYKITLVGEEARDYDTMIRDNKKFEKQTIERLRKEIKLDKKHFLMVISLMVGVVFSCIIFWIAGCG